MSSQEDIILSFISITVFVIFGAYILYLLISTKFAGYKVVITKCPSGSCATNLQSGAKICPTNDTDSLVYDPTQYVCNSKYLCDNPATPYAIQSDGSTNISGQCEQGVACGCLRIARCPNYILSVFTSSNGNPYEGLTGNSRMSFPQYSSYVSQSGVSTSVPPIQINNSTTFCYTSASWLAVSSPGCNFVSSSTIAYDDIVTCMGMASSCTGSPYGNPCLQGTLAFVGDSEGLTQESFITGQFGCVAGTPCPCGQVTIFDPNYGGIICKTLS